MFYYFDNIGIRFGNTCCVIFDNLLNMISKPVFCYSDNPLNSLRKKSYTCGFSGVCVAQSVVLYVVFCRTMFALFILTIVLSVLHRF